MTTTPTTTGTRRLIGWLAGLLAVLLVGGFITSDQFSTLLQSLLGFFA